MEKLTKRSDGIFETASGLFAVYLKRSSGSDGENKWFDFKPQTWGDPVRVRWPSRDEIAVIDHVYATTLFRLRYGVSITQAQADAWNARVDEIELLRDAPALDPAAQAQAEAPAAAAALVPATTTDASGGLVIDPNSLPLEPTPEEIAAAAKEATPNPDPARTQESLGTGAIKEESEIGTEAVPLEEVVIEDDANSGTDASLVPPATSPESQTGTGDEPKGKGKPKRTLS